MMVWVKGDGILDWKICNFIFDVEEFKRCFKGGDDFLFFY